MTNNGTQASAFLVHRLIRKNSRFLLICSSRFMVTGGTVASRRTKGIDTPPPAGQPLGYRLEAWEL